MPKMLKEKEWAHSEINYQPQISEALTVALGEEGHLNSFQANRQIQALVGEPWPHGCISDLRREW